MSYTPAPVQLDGQAPTEVLDHALDFASQIPTGDSLTGSPTVVVASGITLTPSGKASPAVSGTTVVFWLSGGTHGETYEGQATVATTNGRTLVAGFLIAVIDPAPNVPE
jgi:hypothetical protein